MMRIVTPGAEDAVATPNATMTPLATPSRGSSALSTWLVRMEGEQTGPVHAIDREQVWTVLSGTLKVTSDGRTETAGPGQAVLLPPHGMRQFAAEGGTVEVLVAMEAGGAAVLESGEKRPLPWAE